MDRKIVLLSALATLLTFAIPSVSAHNAQGHTRDIVEVFGMNSEKGKDLGSKIGVVIAALIDDKADLFHAKVNKGIAEICCDKQYYSLYMSGYDQKAANWERRLSMVEKKMRSTSFPRKEIIEDTLKISKDIQDDRTFVRKNLSAAACNVEGRLIKLKRALAYGHDFSGKDLKDAIRELKVSLGKDARMPQRSFFEINEQIQDLARSERLFQWSTYGHRLYFHWGMDVRIREFGPLKECVERTCEDLKKLFPRDERDGSRIVELQKRVREKIYSLVEKEWTTRLRMAQEDIDSCLKMNAPDKGLLNNDQCRMILEISYYVHILGDYSTEVTSPLVKEKDIREALSTNLTDYLWGHREGNRKMTDIQNRLVYMDTAEALLNFLKAEIPKLIADSDKIRNALW